MVEAQFFGVEAVITLMDYTNINVLPVPHGGERGEGEG